VSFWPLSDCARITVTEIGLLVVIVQHEVCAVRFWPLSEWTRITVTEIGLLVMVQQL